MTRSLIAHARPFPLDVGGPPPAPPAVLAAADVVGLASSVRTAREVVLTTHVLLRGLVERAGFRAVFLEGSEPVGRELATYVATGGGSPAALISAAQGFLRSTEAVDVVRWLRRWNSTHPHDPVALVHDLEPAQPGSLTEVEAELAHRDLEWLARTGQRVVHCGGAAHLLVGDPRTVHPYGETHQNAGGALRAALGRGYAVAALTVGEGSAGFPVAAPPPDFAEAAFTGVSGTVLLDLNAADDEWLRRPLRTRMIGPRYDPAHNADYRIEADAPLADCIDILVHAPVITPVTPLPPSAA